MPSLSFPYLYLHRGHSAGKYFFRISEGKVPIVWPNGRWKGVGTRKNLKDLNIKLKLTNEKPTWCHLLYYFTSYALNMFRTWIFPSSGACDCVVELPHWSSCAQFVVCWRFGAAGFEWWSFCRLLIMDILMSETCWAHKKWNKIASDTKLVFHSSTITMMHGPINIGWLLFNPRQRSRSFPLPLWTPLGSTHIPITWVPGALSLDAKWTVHEAHLWPVSSAEFRNSWNCTSTVQHIFMVWCVNMGTTTVMLSVMFLAVCWVTCRRGKDLYFYHHIWALVCA